MSELALQHERWTEVRARLWTPVETRRQLPKPVVRVLPVNRRKPVLPPPLSEFGWPIYLPVVFYDHCDGLQMLNPPVTWRVIAREVCAKYGVTMIDLKSPRRTHETVVARHEAFWRCRHETTMSLPMIGRRFGDRDHTTVLHGIRTHAKRLEAANG